MERPDTKKWISEQREKMKAHENEKLLAFGLDPSKLSQQQKDLILEPSEAPENYYHDGELSPMEAYKIWHNSLSKSGLTKLQIFKISMAYGFTK